MYAGTTFRNKSGHIVGVHQKIDRMARKALKFYLKNNDHFPKINEILHFEGNNGPDAIKRKSPSRDEPWHHIDPTDPSDTALFGIVREHRHNLSKAIIKGDNIRAAFEAAWLAHAIVDGLTPAHHFALDKKIEELWGRPSTERLSIKEKNLIKGINKRDSLAKNWQYWGFGGVFTAHIAFELGIASTISTMKYKKIQIDPKMVSRLNDEGFDVLFSEAIHHIHSLGMYEDFANNRWTQKLARKTKRILIPEIVTIVTLSWIEAVRKSR